MTYKEIKYTLSLPILDTIPWDTIHNSSWSMSYLICLPHKQWNKPLADFTNSISQQSKEKCLSIELNFSSWPPNLSLLYSCSTLKNQTQEVPVADDLLLLEELLGWISEQCCPWAPNGKLGLIKYAEFPLLWNYISERGEDFHWFPEASEV